MKKLKICKLEVLDRYKNYAIENIKDSRVQEHINNENTNRKLKKLRRFFGRWWFLVNENWILEILETISTQKQIGIGEEKFQTSKVTIDQVAME